MNLIYLQPADVLFFRDGRPMSGSLAGHGAAWPLPDVTNHALHAALHRAALAGVHDHNHRREGNGVIGVRKFGSLLTAGPFPVAGGTGNPPDALRWFFPRPKDAQLNGSIQVTHRPLRPLAADGSDDPRVNSSLPDPLKCAVVNTEPPSKEAGGEAWISEAAFDEYLREDPFKPKPDDSPHFLRDADLADTEHQIGIGINPETGTAAESQFYSAHYLRLREEVRLGLFAEAMDMKNGDSNNKRDLIPDLLNGRPEQIIVGGQQRLCTAERRDVAGALPLPRGLTSGFGEVSIEGRKRWLLKWILLSPAIWPEIPDRKPDGTPITDKDGRRIHFHPGGWLPNWVRQADGQVMLRSGERQRRNYNGKHTRGFRADAKEIGAWLVAAIVPKPIPVTGWAVAVEDGQSAISTPQSTIRAGGAKTTQLAVPAGAVYYFEAEAADDAANLAAALNWDGTTDGKEIKNRRSTLMGEKGFGLGVCGAWQFHGGAPEA
jgi:CRISPR-associated protein Cmr3